MIRIEHLIAVALFATFVSGCDRYGSSDQGDALEAQEQANSEIDDQQREAADQRAEIRDEVNDKTAKLREDYQEAVAEGETETAEVNDEANARIAEAQASANEKIREANREIDADRSDLEKWSQKKLDSLNAEIDNAKIKAQQGKVAVREDFNAGIAEVEASRDRIAEAFSAAGARGEVTAEEFKKDFDTGITSLKQRVDALAKKL